MTDAPSHPAPSRPAPGGHLALFAGLVLVSTSGPFVVKAGMDAVAVVLYRTTLAAAIFLAFAALRGQLASLRPHAPRLALGGLLLATHFLLWIKAFDLTDVASNLLLLVAQPVAGAALGAWLGERPTRGTYLALGLAAAGLAVIAGGDISLGPRALLGDAMCLVGAFTIALFYVVTREARSAMPLAPFMAGTMACAALITAPVALFAGTTLTGHAAESWAWLGALVLLTTVGGHGLMNLAATRVRLFTVNLVIVLEPAIALALGAWLLGTGVTAIQLGGGVLLAASVIVGMRPERS